MKKTNASEKARTVYYICGAIATIVSIVYVLKNMGVFKKRKEHRIKIDDVADLNIKTVEN